MARYFGLEQVLEHIHDEDFGLSDGEDSDGDIYGMTGYLPPADSSLFEAENESASADSDVDDVNLSLPELGKPNLLERGIFFLNAVFFI